MENYVAIEKYGIKVGDAGSIIGRSGKLVKGEIDKDGYRRIGVSTHSENSIVRKHKFVHRLVCEAFLDSFDENLVVNHKDGDKSNNQILNLEMCTIRENTIHAVKLGLIKSTGEDCRFNKYPESLVRGILARIDLCERLPNGNIKPGELVKVAADLNVTRHIVKNYSRNRKIWKHLL